MKTVASTSKAVNDFKIDILKDESAMTAAK